MNKIIRQALAPNTHEILEGTLWVDNKDGEICMLCQVDHQEGLGTLYCMIGLECGNRDSDPRASIEMVTRGFTRLPKGTKITLIAEEGEEE